MVASPFMSFSLSESKSTMSFLTPCLMGVKDNFMDTFWPGEMTSLRERKKMSVSLSESSGNIKLLPLLQSVYSSLCHTCCSLYTPRQHTYLNGTSVYGRRPAPSTVNIPPFSGAGRGLVKEMKAVIFSPTTAFPGTWRKTRGSSVLY